MPPAQNNNNNGIIQPDGFKIKITSWQNTVSEHRLTAYIIRHRLVLVKNGISQEFTC